MWYINDVDLLYKKVYLFFNYFVFEEKRMTIRAIFSQEKIVLNSSNLGTYEKFYSIQGSPHEVVVIVVPNV